MPKGRELIYTPIGSKYRYNYKRPDIARDIARDIAI